MNNLQRTEWGQKRRASENAERAFQERVIDLAVATGWEYWHAYNATRSKPGFPDLVLFRERVIFAELKARSRLTGRMGKLMPEQEHFRDVIQESGASWYLWTDEDMDEIAQVLKKPGQTARIV